MIFFLHLLYGFVVSFTAMISPGMLNMTALKISLDVGKVQGLKFVFGASLIIFFQVGIALFFADFFVNHPKIILIIEEIGVVVFLLLSIFFFRLSRKSTPLATKKVQRNYLFAGIAIASLDLLTIPFYITITAYLASGNHIIINTPYTLFFMFGVAIGAFTILNLYVHYAYLIAKKVSFITRNINLILSFIFLLLAIITFVNLD